MRGQAAPPAPDPGGVPGKLYFASLGELDFDIDASTKYQETALHDLVVDSLLYAANEIKPGAVDFSIEGSGDIRVSKVEKSSKAGLAPKAIARVYDVLAKLNAAGLAMVLVEQKSVPLPARREGTIVLQSGSIVFQQDRRPSPDELAALYLGERTA